MISAIEISANDFDDIWIYLGHLLYQSQNLHTKKHDFEFDGEDAFQVVLPRQKSCLSGREQNKLANLPLVAISFGQIVPKIGQSSSEKSNHGRNGENSCVKIVGTFDIHRMIMEWSSDIIIGVWCEGDAHVTLELELGSLLIGKMWRCKPKGTNLIIRGNTLGISLLATPV